MRLNVTESGADGPLVVLVHGVLDTQRSFSRVVDLLAAECRLVRYDRRGYGASTDAPGAPVDVGGHVDDLLAVLDGRRAVVVGHSFGGVIAAGAAARAPAQVEVLVMYESALAWAPTWDDRVMRRVLGSDDPEDAGLRLMVGASYEAMSPGAQARLRKRAAAFVREEASTREASPPYDLGRISAPVLYGYSEVFPVDAMRDHLGAVVPDIGFVTIPGGGHFAHRDAPEAFAGLVRQALALRGRLNGGARPRS